MKSLSFESVSTLHVGRCAGVQRHLQFGLGLPLVHAELGQRLLQRVSLSPVELSLLLQDFGHLLVVLQPDTRTIKTRSRGKDNTSSQTN